MSLMKKALTDLKKSAYQQYEKEEKPSKSESLSYFSRCISYSSSLIFKEKEIITFAVLQLICIGLGYYLWVQMLDWIPENVWKSDRNADGMTYVNLVLFLWSFLCVGLTAFPLGILTACMGAAHFLHENGEESTIAKCFRIVLPKAWSIWIFSWLDAWWTVQRIMERLPKKNDRTPLSTKLVNEAIYQAWKVASLGFLPALIIGRGVKDSCRDSLGLLTTHFKTICQLRIAYSVICWIFGIGSYIGCVYMCRYVFEYAPENQSVYIFYVFFGLPMLTALFFIQVIFRPIYILSACQIYSNYVRENNIPVVLPTVTKFSSAIVSFLILAIVIGVVYIFRDELGITKILAMSL